MLPIGNLTSKLKLTGGQMSQTGYLSEKEAEFIAENVRNPVIAKTAYGQDIIRKHVDSTLQIWVNTSDLADRENYEFVTGKAVLTNPAHNFNSEIEIECIVACGKLYKLKSIARGEVINVLDYLPELISDFKNPRSRIGILTFINGIQNSEADFKLMGNSIIKNFKEQKVSPLCIGLYNATNGVGLGFKDDLTRLLSEWKLNAKSVIMMRQLVITLARALPRDIFWAHFAHSEGGLITKEVLTNKTFCLSKQNSSMRDISGKQISTFCDIQGFCKRQLITVLYGAVAPVPDVVEYAINNYSKQDVTMRFAAPYLNRFPKPTTNEDENLKKLAKQMVEHPYFPKTKSAESVFNELKAGTSQIYIDKYPYESVKDGCTVTILNNIGESFSPFAGDHAFQGATYQKALNDNIVHLKNKYKISND